MKVPPEILITIEATIMGADSIPMPIPIPADSISERAKKMKKIAFLDLV
jgi:hypothetical protein